MARFFKTTRPEFVDNFLYQPPWELAISALEKKDADIQNQINTMDVLRNLPIDYHEVDRDTAMQIKNDYANQIDALAQDMQKNLLSPSNRMSLKNLERNIRRNFESGDISKIIANSQSFKNWDAQLQKLNPQERQTYKREMLNNYKANNPNGALSGLFTPDEMYNSRNLLSEFAEYASKNIKDDSISQAFDKVNGQWIIKDKVAQSGVSMDKIQNAFKGWINSQADLPAYFQNREKYFGERYFTPQGTLGFDQQGTTLNNLLNATKSLAYNKSATERSQEVNPYAMEATRHANAIDLQNRSFGQQKALAELKGEISRTNKGASASSAATGPFVGTSVPQGLINVADSFKQKKYDLLNSLRGNLKGNMAKVSNDQILDNVYRNKDKFPSLYKKLKDLEDNEKKYLTASWRDYEEAVGNKQVDYLRKSIDNVISGQTKFHLGNLDGKTVSDRLVDGNFVGKTLNSKIKFKKESAIPISMGTNKMVDDYLRYTIELTKKDENGEDISEDRYIYIPMKELSTNYSTMGMAGATDFQIDLENNLK